MKRRIRPWCRHFTQNNYEFSHRCDAKIALIGEAPGRYEDEDQYGRPFVGPSGYDLTQWWKPLGLQRQDFWIDNTYPFRPNEKNDLAQIDKMERAEYASEMVARLRRQDPTVIVPCGNYALRAILADPKLNISDWRGSVLPWNGRKLIPTLHPAVTQRQKILTKLCIADWERIAKEAQTREYSSVERKLVVAPNVEQMKEFEIEARLYFARPYREASAPRVLSVDVENRIGGNHELYCVGFSFDPTWAITVSTVRRDYEDEWKFNTAQRWITSILTSGYPLVGQNFQTDLYKLVQWNTTLRTALQRNYIWDLIEMAHLLDPNDGGDTKEGSEDEGDGGGVRVGMLDLGTLYSLFGKCPVYYKYMSSSRSWEERAKYNALDAAVQREIFDELWQKLKERGLV